MHMAGMNLRVRTYPHGAGPNKLLLGLGLESPGRLNEFTNPSPPTQKAVLQWAEAMPVV